MGSRSKHTRRYKRGDHWVPRGPQQRGGLPQATRDELGAVKAFRQRTLRWLAQALQAGYKPLSDKPLDRVRLREAVTCGALPAHPRWQDVGRKDFAPSLRLKRKRPW